VYGTVNQVDASGNPVPPANTINWGATSGVANGAGTGLEYLVNGGANVGTPIRLGASNPGWSPIGVVNNSLSLVESIASGGAPLFAQQLLGDAPALGFGMQYLDDIQVDLLVKATQADERSMSLASPRLTFFNGQGAWIAITTEEAYVASLTAATGTGSGAFVPQVATLNTGVMLHIKGAASSDRRYVTMNVNFQKSELEKINNAFATGAAGGGGIGGGGASPFVGQVQLPVVSVQQLRVTTSVPDKGTAMLGGYRTSDEYETEAGVPFLSKIPYINRFFANRITATSENTMLILLRPEIILQHENEDQLFPGLNESLRLGSASSGR
jgi:type II secretory pathway component GspD/PulD (secretin)